MITRPELIAARRRLHLTQQQLADELGVAVRTVVNWEKKTDHPEPGHGAVSETEQERVRRLLFPPTGSGLAEMSNAALVAQMQQILGILAARLEEHTPTEGVGSGFGQEASEVSERTVHAPSVAEPPSRAIRGRMGMPPRTTD